MMMKTTRKTLLILLILLFSFSISTIDVKASSFSLHAVSSAKNIITPVANEIVIKGKDYYFIDSRVGGIRRDARFIKFKGHFYYVQEGGAIARGKTFSVRNNTYKAWQDGKVATGVYKWGDSFYYYSDPNNARVKTNPGFVNWEGNKYYVNEAGRIETGKSFYVNNKKYYAYSMGIIATGVYKLGSNYYYSDPKTGELITKEGFVKWDGKFYYVQKGGVLATDRPVISNNNLPYSANVRGECKRLPLIKTNNRPLYVAQRQVGVSTGKKYWRWYFGTRFIDTDRTPWCATFAAWCYNQANQINKISGAGNLAYVPCYTRFANRRGKWVNPKNAKGGDLIIFGRGSRHIGIVEQVYKGYIITIEGNSGPTAAYGSRQPGAVTRRVYKLDDNDIRGVIRP